MLVTLSKEDPHYAVTGWRQVSVLCEDCPHRACFDPADWPHVAADGKLLHDFRCKTREYKKCPPLKERAIAHEPAPEPNRKNKQLVFQKHKGKAGKPCTFWLYSEAFEQIDAACRTIGYSRSALLARILEKHLASTVKEIFRISASGE